MSLKKHIIFILLLQCLPAIGQDEKVVEKKNTIKAIAYLYPLPDPGIFHWAFGYERNLNNKCSIEALFSKISTGTDGGSFSMFSSNLGTKYIFNSENKLLNNCYVGVFFRYQHIDYKPDQSPDFSTKG